MGLFISCGLPGPLVSVCAGTAGVAAGLTVLAVGGGGGCVVATIAEAGWVVAGSGDGGGGTCRGAEVAGAVFGVGADVDGPGGTVVAAVTIAALVTSDTGNDVATAVGVEGNVFGEPTVTGLLSRLAATVVAGAVVDRGVSLCVVAKTTTTTTAVKTMAATR